MRQRVADAIRAIFNVPVRAEAERLLGKMCDQYCELVPRLTAWAEVSEEWEAGRAYINMEAE